jgi:predicted porin
MSAVAGAKTYGAVHVSGDMDTVGDADAQTSITLHRARGSKFGIKGSTDTNMMGMKAIYQFEAGFDGSAGAGLDGKPGQEIYGRDTWAGLSSKSIGTLQLGTIALNYKKTGKALDPLFTTAFESRNSGWANNSTKLLGGSGDGRGRSHHHMKYTSPSVAGAKVVFDYNFAAGVENNMGLGVVYKNGPIMAIFDWYNNATAGIGDGGSLMKVGAKYGMGATNIYFSYEMDDGIEVASEDSTWTALNLMADYKMGATVLVGGFGMTTETLDGAGDEATFITLAVKQMLAKKTELYAGYKMKSTDVTAAERSMISGGLKYSF